jgi:hypothetical protein
MDKVIKIIIVAFVVITTTAALSFADIMGKWIEKIKVIHI